MSIGTNRYKWKNKRPIAILAERENPNTLTKMYILRFAKVSRLQFFPRPYQSMFNQLFNSFQSLDGIDREITPVCGNGLKFGIMTLNN